MSADEIAEMYGQYEREAEILGKVGAALFSQPTTLTLRLPGDLAEQALAAWLRDDPGDLPDRESMRQTITRRRAGMLALIGLAVEQTGRAEDNDIACDLDAWEVGAAFEAADDYGLLLDRVPATTRGPHKLRAGAEE
jgi:hypothetical protein